MPPVIAAATIALVEVGFSFATAIAITGAIASFAVSQIVSYGIGLLTSSKARQSTGANVDRLADLSRFLTQSAIETHKIIYGKTRIAGNISFRGFSNTGETKSTTGTIGSLTSNNAFQHMIIALAGHECDSITEIYADDLLLTIDADGYVTNSEYTFNNTYAIRINKHYGSPTQTVDTDLQTEYPDWDSDHRLRGICYIYVRFRMEFFTDSLPNISSVVKGAKVYDPRTATTAWSDNWALCVLDYLTNTQYGFGADISTEIDTTSFNAAANLSDESVSILPSGSQSRYTANGVLDTGAILVDNLQALVSGGAGAVIYEQGKFKCFGASYDTPTITIDDSWFSGDIELLTRKPRTELYNAVKGTMIDPNKLYAATDFPEVTNATYQTEDGGEKIVNNIELPFTNDVQRAQRIAKIILEKGRQGITATLNLNLKALQISVWDNIYITNSTLGWSSKVFKVLSWSFNSDGGITIQVQEEASGSYSWSSAEATVTDTAPDTNLPSPSVVPALTNLVLTSGTSTLYLRNDGTVFSRIKATWDASASPYVQFNGQIEVQYKQSAASVWEKNNYVGGSETFDFILDVQDGQEYDVRIRAINSLGFPSDWTYSNNHTVVGKTAPPTDVASLVGFQNGGAIILRWGKVDDADLEGYEVRYGSAGASWDSLFKLTEVNAGTEITSLAVPPANYDFCLKSVDTSGNYSTNAICINLDVANNNDVVVESLNAPLWSGTKTNMLRNPLTSCLVPDDQNLATGNNFDVFDNFVMNPYSTYSYEYSQLDVGIDAIVRIYSNATYAAGAGETDPLDIVQQIDYKTSAGSYDGYEDVNLVGTVNARYAKFKFIMNWTASNGLAYFSEFDNIIDAQERQESGANVAISVGGTTITYATPFIAIPSVNATVVGATGLYAVITSLTTSSFIVKVYNSSGTDVGGTINWSAIGV